MPIWNFQKQAIEQTDMVPVIFDATTLLWCHCNENIGPKPIQQPKRPHWSYEFIKS